jgi:3-oxoacyl-[acyl-carrier protein] reductase
MASTRIALITGGAQGIGFAIAKRFIGAGHCVVLCDVNADALRKAEQDLSGGGAKVLALSADVTQETAVAQVMTSVDAKFGRLDIVVNSAGILGLVNNKVPRVEDTPTDLWNRVIGVNLNGPFFVCRAAVPFMRRNKWGRIINIASRAARMRAGDPAYSASKAGLVALSRVLAGDTGGDGITVNCIAPSRVATPLTAQIGGPEVMARKIAETPMGRIATPEDIAGVAAFLASEDAGFVTGAIVDVTGGSFMP